MFSDHVFLVLDNLFIVKNDIKTSGNSAFNSVDEISVGFCYNC